MPPSSSDDGRCHRLDRGPVGDVAQDGKRLPALRFHALGDRVDLLLHPIHDGDLSAGGGQRAAHVRPQPAAASRDDRDPAVEAERVNAHLAASTGLVSARGTARCSRAAR